MSTSVKIRSYHYDDATKRVTMEIDNDGDIDVELEWNEHSKLEMRTCLATGVDAIVQRRPDA